MSSFKEKMIWNAVFAVFLLGNIILSPNLIFLNVYAAAIGFHIINRIYWETPSELLYHFVLLFSVMDFTYNLPLLGRYNIYYLHIGLFILTVIMFVNFLRGRPSLNPLRLGSNRYILFLTVFIAYMLLSLTWAEVRGSGIKYVINYAIMICFMLAVYTYNPTKEKVKETLKTLFWATLPIFSIALLEVAQIRMPIRNVYLDNGWYVKGAEYLKTIPTVFFYNPNNFAVFLVMFMCFAVAFIAYNRDRFKGLVLWGLQLLAVLSLIFTTSRTAYIVMLLTMLGFISFFVITKEWEKFRKAVAIGLASTLMFYALSFMPSMFIYYDKFKDTPILGRISYRGVATNQPIAQVGEEGSLNDRWGMMVNISRGVFIEGNYKGFGVNNTTTFLGKQTNIRGKQVNPHSLWFEVLGDFGIGIFLYFVFIYLSLLWDLTRVYIRSKEYMSNSITSYLSVSLIAALGGFILTSFAPSSVISFPQMWLLFGLAGSLIIRQNSFLVGTTEETID